MNRDIITIGASAGGLEVLLELVNDLPRDLPASLFVVVHVPAAHDSMLPEILSSRGKLPAHHPLHLEAIERGHIYIAPPDMHLQLRPGAIAVVRGPRESGHRPAANTLFRSAAAAYGSRVIGVVLSGYLDCGTAGMMSIKARGGVAVVQAPETAAAPDMPQSVIDHVEVDHVISPRGLGELLVRLATSEAGPARDPDAAIARLEGAQPGARSELVCPACDGVLTEADAGEYQHYRCHVGHTFSLAALVREQGRQMERALWAAVRALEEGAALSRQLAAREDGSLRERFREKAVTQQAEADLIRGILLHGSGFDADDAARLA